MIFGGMGMPEARLPAAQKLLETIGCDALLVLGLTNIRYLTGFSGSDGALLLGRDGQWLLCDSRYTTQGALEAPHCGILEYKVKSDGIAALVAGQGWGRLAFDAEQVTVAMHGKLAAAMEGVELLPLSGELDELRLLKSAAELEAIEQSCIIASTALEKLLPMIRPGVDERTLALELEILMKHGGAEEKAFDFIVASGERGALPHGRPSGKKVAPGELVTIDFGARLNGYHSDETVTVAVASADDRQREIYSVVKEAHDLAVAAIRPGVGCREVDAIARDFISSRGYGDYFGHGLGHGVGLEIHEKPTLSPRGEQSLAQGMIVTVEPGIYIPGWGGVRIEDTVAVTADGCRLLTKVPKELLFVG